MSLGGKDGGGQGGSRQKNEANKDEARRYETHLDNKKGMRERDKEIERKDI